MLLNENEARQFLAKVMPWPPEGESDGYCCLIWTQPDRKNPDKDYYNDRAARTPSELINTLNWIAGLKDTRNIYACMSRQRDAEEKVSKKNADYHYLRAKRSSIGALGFRSLYLDLDFKQYADRSDAEGALQEFLQASGLPDPSVEVLTGGGMHLHWTADRVMAPAEWRPLAEALVGAVQKHGLKCDTQCTIDAARILRVPGTRNFKYDPVRPVELLHCAITDYPIEQLQQMLAPYVGLTPQRSAPAKAGIVIPFPAKAPLKEPSELAAGIEERRLSYRPVAKECAFFGHALKTGGRDYANPLWHLSVLMTVFMEHDRQLAHLISQGHASYTYEETDKLFDRKVDDHKRRGIGYPSCRSIQQDGCSFCAACPHFAKGKSPLNIALAPQPTPQQAAVARASPLPAGYRRNAAGWIYGTVKDDDGNDVDELVSDIPMTDAFVTEEPGIGWVFNFTAQLGAHTREIKLPMSQNTATERQKVLPKQGFVIETWKTFGSLIVSWFKQLQTIKDTVVKTDTFGWVNNDAGDARTGFAYGGTLWTQGEPQRVPVAKTGFTVNYQPIGTLEPWKQAALLITDQHRPALDLILASAFAAPLVTFFSGTATPTLIVSAHSQETGLGKSTAMQVAQGVWGGAAEISNLTDTLNSIDKRFGALHSLPIYWDEMNATQDNSDDMSSHIMRLCSGKGKGRLNRNAEHVQPGQWSTMLITASNRSLVNRSMVKNSDAILVRLFEFEVPPSTGQGQLPRKEVADRLQLLQENYGVAGKVYAEWLGKNFPQIHVDVLDEMHRTDAEVRSRPDERFWVNTIIALILGARYANQLGLTQIDESALRQFLINCLSRLRARRARDGIDWKDPIKVSTVFHEFLEDARPHLLHSGIVPSMIVPKNKDQSTVVPFTPTNATYWAHIGRDSDTIDIRRKPLEDWCEKTHYNVNDFTKALKELANAEYVQKIFGRNAGPMQIELLSTPESLLHVNYGALRRRIEAAQGATNALRNTNESRSAEDP